VGGVVVVVGFVALIVFTMFAGFVASVVFVPFAVVVASAHLHVLLFGFGGGAGGMGEVRVVVGEMRVVAVFEEMRCQMKAEGRGRVGFLVLAVGAVGGFEDRMVGMLCGFRPEHKPSSLRAQRPKSGMNFKKRKEK
jgi:hypothetical protein